ncbi:RsmB/NOP family class I SAM-dependent RNA methyltransferase [Demequina sp.]|uniref:RsmB/NOP family class I SAM-dependent RNA methyltransferase n=1 Tax=Demequina sp. TaxID=2050685 RepID=UPI003D0CDA5D
MSPGTAIDAAREAAFRCVRDVDADDAYANLAMPGILSALRLSGRDAGFATELAYGALRMRGYYDAVIAHAARRDPSSLDNPVRWSLWLGAHQALSMRVPAHAAVSETVDLARRHGGPRVAPLVNAVMRRIVEREPAEWAALVAPSASREDLALRHSHPLWVVNELAAALAEDSRAPELEALLAADNEPAAVTLVARPGLAERDALPGTPAPLSPWGVTLAGGDPGAIPEVASGTAAVQDEGSQVVAGALVAHREVAPGETWLDMCAGPGGKAALLGALAAQHGATVDANEIHEHRAQLVRNAVRALPEGVVTVTTADSRNLAANAYDRVLLDAPCTGLGALRRRPEARWRREPADVAALAELQAELLAAAAAAVKPGGVVAYVTCSPVLAETRDVVAAAHGLELVDARPAVAELTGTPRRSWGPGPHVQLWPHVHGTDAMYLAILERPRG